MTPEAALLLLGLLVAHFLGDFTPLATSRMLEAKAVGRPLLPIASHAAVHGALVAAAVAALARPGLGLVGLAALLEFVAHFALDWVRGRLGAERPAVSNSDTQQFWTVLGLDQLAHGAVLVGIAALVLR